MENQLTLEKNFTTYKLIIPLEVEKKIRHLCTKISQIEWSGILFYTHTGTYENNDLTITCVDIFPMDIGSQAYTEFNMSPDVIAYMTNHPDLLDCQTGLIHSHNRMASFFSTTDINTLKEEGADRNHFVSLIVNNEGTYAAAITRKLTKKIKTDTYYSYKSFGDIEKEGTFVEEGEEVVISYNYLDIIKEEPENNSFDELDERLEFIKSNKEKKEIKNNIYNIPYVAKDFTNIDYTLNNYKQASLFDYKDNNIVIPEDTIKSVAIQLLTGSIILTDNNKIDPIKWASQMIPIFNKRFGDNIEEYKIWIDTLADFILSTITPIKYYNNEGEYVSALCSAIDKFLSKLPKNKYIKAIQDSLTTWII